MKASSFLKELTFKCPTTDRIVTTNFFSFTPVALDPVNNPLKLRVSVFVKCDCSDQTHCIELEPG